jgi:hypothetical protein
MDRTEYDSILRSLTAIADHQAILISRFDAQRADLRACLAQYDVLPLQRDPLVQRINEAFDRIDEKLDRIFPERSEP